MNNITSEQEFELFREKISNIEEYAKDKNLDISSEIKALKDKYSELQKGIYENLKPWDKVKIARHAKRPTSLDYINVIIEDFIELHGDRYFKDDESIIGGIGIFAGRPVTVIAQQKGKNTKENVRRNFGMPNPEGYRKALRLMKQAEKFNRPIITLIDTPGAYPGLGAEERGQAEAIARNLLEMSKLEVPVVSIVVGEGGSGGALALGVSNKVLMLENSIYSVISPEGLSSILWKDATKAEDAANIMKLTAKDLFELEVIDAVVDEPVGGAHNDFELTAKNMKKALEKELKKFEGMDSKAIRDQRYDRFRQIGDLS